MKYYSIIIIIKSGVEVCFLRLSLRYSLFRGDNGNYLLYVHLQKLKDFTSFRRG